MVFYFVVGMKKVEEMMGERAKRLDKQETVYNYLRRRMGLLLPVAVVVVLVVL